ncbi:MAG TPA: hypothetical protein VHC44_16175, partial [Verrucomicrobiae bacterium]|nr:hypothetical protein [Verrucomicrobiae bacterium]
VPLSAAAGIKVLRENEHADALRRAARKVKREVLAEPHSCRISGRRQRASRLRSKKLVPMRDIIYNFERLKRRG